MNTDFADIRIFPKNNFRQIVAEVDAWTSQHKLTVWETKSDRFMRHSDQQILPVVWDAGSPERTIANVLIPFLSTASEILSSLELRRQRLQNTPNPLGVKEAGGRLLVYEPWLTVQDGLSETYSDGFYDVSDCPPPACWVAYLINEGDIAKNVANTSLGNLETDWLICYVPPVWIPLAEKGMIANTTTCLKWYDAKLEEGHLIFDWLWQQIK